MPDLRKRYVDLLKKSILNAYYGQKAVTPVPAEGVLKGFVRDLFRSRWGIELVRIGECDEAWLREGHGQPWAAFSMIGMSRMENIEQCIDAVLADDVPGDLIETGVHRGGATIFMRGVLASYGVTDRKVFVADSFEGLPEPDPEKFPADEGDEHHTHDNLAVSLEEVRENFSRYDLLDDQVIFLKGWFKDTLPDAPIEKLAVLRLDGDMYQSTWEALEALYPKVSEGGFVIVDDYGGLPNCKRAVEDYRREFGIEDEIHRIDWTGVYWRKGRPV